MNKDQSKTYLVLVYLFEASILKFVKESGMESLMES